MVANGLRLGDNLRREEGRKDSVGLICKAMAFVKERLEPRRYTVDKIRLDRPDVGLASADLCGGGS